MYCHQHRAYQCGSCYNQGFGLGNGFSSTIADIEAMELDMQAVQDFSRGDFADGITDVVEAEFIQDFLG
jgi:hypothetical protein